MSRNGSVERLCPICEKIFKLWPSVAAQPGRTFCSRACWTVHLSRLSPEEKAKRQKNLKRTREQILEHGRMGGYARAAKLTPEQRSEASRRAIKARFEQWGPERTRENMRRAQAIAAIARLQPICQSCKIRPKAPIPSTNQNIEGKRYHGYCTPCNRMKRKCLTFGLSKKQFDDLMITGMRCGICGTEEGKIVIDHDHATGVIRGLLCSDHNFMVAYVERTPPDVMERARDYISGNHLNIVPENEPRHGPSKPRSGLDPSVDA